MNTRPTPSSVDDDLEATAELPVVDFAPDFEDASAAGASTDVFPVPVIPVGTSELADRLREVEQRLHRKSERVRQQEILLKEAGEQRATLEAQLLETRARLAGVEAQLDEARTLVQQESQRAVEISAAASRHHAHELTELRSRSVRLLEALASWESFRSMSDALLAEAEARNSLLESQVAALGESLRALEGERMRAVPLAPLERHDGNDALGMELAALKSEIGALQTELLVVRERQQPDPGDTGTLAQLKAPPADSPWVLVRQDGDGERVHPIGRRTTIGRTPDNGIQIDAHNVSRHHAVLLTSSDHCIVEDLNSTNGVLVNGRRVVRHVLREGDIVTVGKTEFRFRQRP